jgi:hypothetical protein
MITNATAAKDKLEALAREIVDGGIVHEGFQYDPYGIHNTFDGRNGDNGSAVKSYDWQVGFQCGLIDPVAETVYFQARDYNPAFGSSTEQDPLCLGNIDLGVAGGIDIA